MWSCRVDGPDSRIVIGAACCEMADVWREENSSYISVMSLKGCHWYQRGDVAILDHPPDVNVALEREGNWLARVTAAAKWSTHRVVACT